MIEMHGEWKAETTYRTDKHEKVTLTRIWTSVDVANVLRNPAQTNCHYDGGEPLPDWKYPYFQEMSEPRTSIPGLIPSTTKQNIEDKVWNRGATA